MCKFSIIVPVYNVEKYLKECLDSILSQTYDNYEVIIVNDGTEDKSQLIIDEYAKNNKKIKPFIKKNGGLSSARNYGIKKASGDYLVFIDSDDTVNNQLLEKLNEEIEKNGKLDIIRIKYNIVGEKANKTISDTFSNISGEDAFINLINEPLFVAAPLSIYRRKFWEENNFSFDIGRYHEDFGLIPYVYVVAKSVSFIDYVGYNYFIRENSITTDTDIQKKKERNIDTLYFFDKLILLIDSEDRVSTNTKKVFKSFLANSLYNKLKNEKGELFKEYLYKLKNKKVYKYLLNDSILRRIKKGLIKVMPGIYVKFFM